MSDINRQKKAQLRQKFKQLRDALTAPAKKQLDLQIFNRLIASSAFQNAQKIGVYYSFSSEVDTHQIITEALKMHKKIFLPAVIDKDLEFRQFNPEKIMLETGPYGIKQPSEESYKINKNELDLIIVPGLAFDIELNRLGYGGGYYDRFLSNLSCLKLALAYDFQVVRQLPASPGDIKMDALLTEKKALGKVKINSKLGKIYKN